MIPKIVWVIGLLAGSLGPSQTVGQTAPPFPTFPVVRNNSGRTEPVSLHDLVPFGVALERLPDNRLGIERAQGWTASNFIPFGMCWDGKTP